MQSTDLHVDAIEFALHIVDFRTYNFYDVIFLVIMYDIMDLLYGAAGLSHCCDKKEGTDLGRRIVVITVIGIHFRSDDILLIVIP